MRTCKMTASNIPRIVRVCRNFSGFACPLFGQLDVNQPVGRATVAKSRWSRGMGPRMGSPGRPVVCGGGGEVFRSVSLRQKSPPGFKILLIWGGEISLEMNVFERDLLPRGVAVATECPVSWLADLLREGVWTKS